MYSSADGRSRRHAVTTVLGHGLVCVAIDKEMSIITR